MIIGVSGKMQSGKDLVASIIQYLTNPFDRDMKTEFNLNEDYSVGNKWKIKKFADKLKDIVCLLTNCTREQLEDREFKEKELGEEWWYFKGRNGSLISYSEGSKRNDEDLIKTTPRFLLQLLGTECGRDILHPNIWVNALMSEYVIKKHSVGIDKYGHQTIVDKYPNWIITDMRFPNELKAVKDRGGISIRIERGLNSTNGKCRNECEDFPNCKPCGVEFEKHESETALDNAKFDEVITNDGSIEDLIEKVKIIMLKYEI